MKISLLYISSTNASWFESFVRIQWKIKCGALPEQEKVPEYWILRHFLSFRAPYLELNKIESKWIPVTLPRVPTTTIRNLVLIYQVHLVSGSLFVPKRGFPCVNWHFSRSASLKGNWELLMKIRALLALVWLLDPLFCAKMSFKSYKVPVTWPHVPAISYQIS